MAFNNHRNTPWASVITPKQHWTLEHSAEDQNSPCSLANLVLDWFKIYKESNDHHRLHHTPKHRRSIQYLTQKMYKALPASLALNHRQRHTRHLSVNLINYHLPLQNLLRPHFTNTHPLNLHVSRPLKLPIPFHQFPSIKFPTPLSPPLFPALRFPRIYSVNNSRMQFHRSYFRDHEFRRREGLPQRRAEGYQRRGGR